MISRLRRRGVFLALLFAFVLVAAACGDDDDVAAPATAAPTTTTTAAPATTTTAAPATTTTAAPTTTTVPATTLPPPASFKVCQVSDTGGIDDKSFNETAWNGALRAEAELPNTTAKFLESQSPADFRPNIDSFIGEGCDLIVTVGFLLADDTAAAAFDNPDQRFAILDFPTAFAPFVRDDGSATSNVRGVTFRVQEAAFLTGYVSAGMSQTGAVGTFGGINIPPVVDFMDGFFWGVQQYNADNGTSVRVIGWDPANPEGGLFTGNFESTEDGFAFGQSLIDEGADVIMPVAGPVGLGTAQAVVDNPGTMIVGVDADWFFSTEFGSVVLTSVLKRLDTAVFNTANNVVTLGSVGNDFVGTLNNDGVGIAPYHDFDGAVPQALKDRVDELRAAIIAGTQSVTGPGE